MPLQAVESCEVLVLVDNVTDLLSSVPASVTSEVGNLFAAGARRLAGRCLCCAQWGLALVITVQHQGRRHTVLFDSGPDGYALRRNGRRLGLDFGTIGAAVWSHGHWDHVGGMPTALRLITAARGGAAVPLHVNDGMFVRRAVPAPGGHGMLPFADIPSPEALEAAGAVLISSPDARTVFNDTFYLSGEVPRITPYEVGLPGQMAQTADGQWVSDQWLRDERWLAVRVAGLGVIVFTACSHAGVINVLNHAQAALAPEPLYAVMGGLHLSGPAAEALIDDTVHDLQAFQLRCIVPGHCTGWRAVHRLVDAFGEAVVVPSAVGRRHHFSAAAMLP